MPRTYDMTNRSRSAADTEHRILDATEALLRTAPVDSVTLQAIAETAGVAVQTVLRHTGSREGCLELVGQRVADRVRVQRESSPPGDVRGALIALMDHYEREGLLILSLLAQEPRGGFAAEAAARGRDYHRAWVEASLAIHVVRPSQSTVDALVAATDLYVWKLLRQDLHRSPEATLEAVARLVDAVLEAS